MQLVLEQIIRAYPLLRLPRGCVKCSRVDHPCQAHSLGYRHPHHPLPLSPKQPVRKHYFHGQLGSIWPFLANKIMFIYPFVDDCSLTTCRVINNSCFCSCSKWLTSGGHRGRLAPLCSFECVNKFIPWVGFLFKASPTFLCCSPQALIRLKVTKSF